MRKFLLFCVECITSFILYYMGIALAGLGFILILLSSSDGFWWVALIGVPLVLAGGWIQFKHWGW